MGEYYIFTIFVFVLCLMLIFAVKLLILKGPKQDTSRDEKLLKLYAQVEEMMESFEEYADDIKAELEDEKKKILRDIRIETDDIKSGHEYQSAAPVRTVSEKPIEQSDGKIAARTVKNAADMYKTAIMEKKAANEKEEEEKIVPEAFSEVKSNEDLSVNAQIVSMHKNGMSLSEIAKKMNMNISEINLIIMKNPK